MADVEPEQVNTRKGGKSVSCTPTVAEDPPMLNSITGDPDQLGAVRYAANREPSTVNATISLPATFYVALSFANNAAVRQSLLNDIEIQAGGEGLMRLASVTLNSA